MSHVHDKDAFFWPEYQTTNVGLSKTVIIRCKGFGVVHIVILEINLHYFFWL